MNSITEEIIEKNSQLIKNNTSISGINNYISKLNDQIQELLNKTFTAENNNDRLNELRQQQSDLNKDKEKQLTDKIYLDYASTLLKDGGIKTKIIKQYLPIMNKLINKYLTSMNSFVNFNLDENFEETIKSRHRDDFSYYNFSEGEKLRIDLAIILTWRDISKMKNSVNTNLLIMDEVFDRSMDSMGTEEFIKIMYQLSHDTNVFVISHRGDQLFDKFRSVIKFENKNNFSRMIK